eukprot:GCRY01001354.1.p1 GENE.GCRY01001354.1~~GCRY01001354.1.p1  ORF type:complete len:279 (+),score=26.25 GCRY01001354.1:144-980(+)
MSEAVANRLAQIKHKILVLSGKGGVGKSTVSTQLALELAEKGFKVGLLDIDICGPSIPKMLGLEGQDIYQSSNGWEPQLTGKDNNLLVMSIGFLVNDPNKSIVWRGPKKTAMINQFLGDVNWGQLDFLVIDTPPGTSDEHISIMEVLQQHNPDGAVLVTTPQKVAVTDVKKEVTFCRKVKLPILGVVENMSTFVCPNCSHCTDIFMKGGGEQLAEQYSLAFLGALPIDHRVALCAEQGRGVRAALGGSGTADAFAHVVDKLLASMSMESAEAEDTPMA